MKLPDSVTKEVIIPEDVVIEAYNPTAIVLYDHDITIHVVKNSWADINFEKMFEGAFRKQYYESE